MKRYLIALALIALFIVPTTASALSGSLGGASGSSGGSGTGSGGQTFAYTFAMNKALVREWVFGSSTRVPSSKNYKIWYSVDDYSGAVSAATVRGGINVLDHWNVYIVAPTVDDPEGNGVKDNTTKSITAAVEVRAWEPPTSPKKPNGEEWEQWWHNNYWDASTNTNGVPRPAKTDYGTNGQDGYAEKSTYTASDPHIHQWFSSSKNESHKIRSDEWNHSLVNEATLSGGRLITVTGNNGGKSYPKGDERRGDPNITVDSGAMAMDLTSHEGRYALFIYGIGGRGNILNGMATSDVVRRPRVRLVSYSDLNGNGVYDAGEELPNVVSYQLTLPAGTQHKTAVKSPVMNDNTILGQDANGDARLEIEKNEVIGRDVLYPAPVTMTAATTVPKNTVMVDGSTKSVTRRPVTQRGYTLSLSAPDYNINAASVTREYYVGNNKTTEPVNILGNLQVTDYAAGDYEFAGGTMSGSSYLVDGSGRGCYSGIQFGYSAANGYDGGIYTIFVAVAPKTSPIHGKVYFDRNQNGVREASEPLIPSKTVNTLLAAGNGLSGSYMVGSSWSLVDLAAADYQLTMTLGATNIPWVLTTPALQTVTVGNSGVPIEVLWGAYADFTPTAQPQLPTSGYEWMDTGRELTIELAPLGVSGASDSWTPSRTFLLQPTDNTQWDWVNYQQTLKRLSYKTISGNGSVYSEPQSWLSANANWGIDAAADVFWAGKKSYDTVDAALAEQPEYRYSDGKSRIDTGKMNASFVATSVVGVDLKGGVNYYELVLWQHKDISWSVVDIDGEPTMVANDTTTYNWGFGPVNVKVFTAKPRY